VFFKASTTFC
jgi:hypothetical protein